MCTEKMFKEKRCKVQEYMHFNNVIFDGLLNGLSYECTTMYVTGSLLSAVLLVYPRSPFCFAVISEAALTMVLVIRTWL